MHGVQVGKGREQVPLPMVDAEDRPSIAAGARCRGLSRVPHAATTALPPRMPPAVDTIHSDTEENMWWLREFMPGPVWGASHSSHTEVVAGSRSLLNM